MIIPPNTVVPTECRPFSPAPVATTSGTTPRINASEVIKIGRNRIVAACTADSISGIPRSPQLFGKFHDQNRVLARQAQPASPVPTWQNTSFCSPRIHCAPSAPSSAIGTASSTMNGSTKLSYCAESVRYTTSVPSPNRISEVAARLQFLQRQPGPAVRKSLRHLFRQIFHRSNRLPRADIPAPASHRFPPNGTDCSD